MYLLSLMTFLSRLSLNEAQWFLQRVLNCSPVNPMYVSVPTLLFTVAWYEAFAVEWASGFGSTVAGFFRPVLLRLELKQI